MRTYIHIHIHKYTHIYTTYIPHTYIHTHIHSMDPLVYHKENGLWNKLQIRKYI